MPPKQEKKLSSSEEELLQVIKVTSLTGAGCAFAASILAICATVLPWWTGTQASQLLKVGLDGTETTISSSITLWSFDLLLQLAPDEGELEGKEHRLMTTWDDTCLTAEQTMPVVPGECFNITVARAFTILVAILSPFSAVFVILSRRFSNLLLLAAGSCSLLSVFCSLGGVFMGVMTSTGGLTGVGFIMLLVAVGCSALAVCAIFYAATKAMPGESGAKEETRGSRLKRAQEAGKKNADMAAALEEGQRRKKKEQEQMADMGDGKFKKPPALMQKVIFWTEEHMEEYEEIPLELLQAAYHEIDEDGSGSLTLEELVEALKACGLNASQEATTQVMKEIDKNMDGTIDIHEFVLFFRTLEEMTQFQKKTEQRAQFLTFICNFCFLAHIIIVGVMLMVFIRMDESANPDNYTIMKNMLLGFSVVLGLLFCSVIAIPAGRMTIGPNIVAWQYHYHKAMQAAPRRVGNNQSGQSQVHSGGLRGAAWTEGAGIGPGPVNAAKYGASYRVGRATYDQSADTFAALASGGSQRGALTNTEYSMDPSGRDSHTAGSSSHGVNAAGGPPGAIMSKTGEFMRYDPAAYRTAAMSSMGARMPMSFTPMQVQNLGTSSDDPAMPQGMMAIDNGGGAGSFYQT
eukprot:gb/GFBE01082329.1/.p1 GENE.gb/GFBE01082329.1/~~gb/GFBE01082329.1/.p1  ORF type:complete len:631 (+),score=166.02 gb/GFBE01082329.1/:1-1893(+)